MCRTPQTWRCGGPVVLLNAAEAWWVQGDQGEGASAAGILCGSGKALAFRQVEPTAMLVAEGDIAIRLVVTQATPYAFTAAVSASCPAGTYALWLHNGLGAAGWQQAGMGAIAAGPVWKADRFNVRDFGVKPEPAIRAAVAAAAANGGGVVLLPHRRSGPESNRNFGAGIAVYGHNFTVSDCDVLASDFGIYLVNAHHGQIIGNTICYGGGGYRIESSPGIVSEDNTVEGFGLTAIGNDIATFWSNACTYLYVANNRLRRMFGADHEMMTLDVDGGAYRGTASSGAWQPTHACC